MGKSDDTAGSLATRRLLRLFLALLVLLALFLAPVWNSNAGGATADTMDSPRDRR